MNEKEKEALREMRSRIDEMLEEPEDTGVELGFWGDLSLWKTKNGLELRWAGAVAAAHDHPVRLMYWLAKILENQRPRMYPDNNILPNRVLRWTADTWMSGDAAMLKTGDVWLPLPPDYEEEA